MRVIVVMYNQWYSDTILGEVSSSAIKLLIANLNDNYSIHFMSYELADRKAFD